MALEAIGKLGKFSYLIRPIAVRLASSEPAFPPGIGEKSKQRNLMSPEYVKEWHKKEATALEKFKFTSAGYHRYGLLHDDLYCEMEWDVEEAIRRLPKKIKQERDYRSIRAIQCSIQNTILPEDQWSKIDDDHHYLEPYVEEVRKERREREDWEKNH